MWRGERQREAGMVGQQWVRQRRRTSAISRRPDLTLAADLSPGAEFSPGEVLVEHPKWQRDGLRLRPAFVCGGHAARAMPSSAGRTSEHPSVDAAEHPQRSAVVAAAGAESRRRARRLSSSLPRHPGRRITCAGRVPRHPPGCGGRRRQAAAGPRISAFAPVTCPRPMSERSIVIAPNATCSSKLWRLRDPEPLLKLKRLVCAPPPTTHQSRSDRQATRRLSTLSRASERNFTRTAFAGPQIADVLGVLLGTRGVDANQPPRRPG